MPPAQMRVAIVGAGITGLLAAQGLKKNGIDVTVFDRDDALDARARDWTILIHWAMPLFYKLLHDHIASRVSEAICNPNIEYNEEVEKLPVYNGLTGEILFASPTPGARRISRQKLRRILARDLDIQWGSKLCEVNTAADDTLQLVFENGDTFDADYVVGTDGSASKVREILLGAEKARPTPCGFMFATGICQYGDAEKVDAILEAHPVASLMMGSDAVGAVGVMYAENADDHSTWTTFWVKIWKGEPLSLHGPEALAYMKANSSNLRGPFKSAIDWTPEGSPCDIDEMRYWIATPWDNRGGRVTLLGDAAHPMLIFRGQGLQHAMVDASNYVDVMLKLRDSGADAAATTVREEAMAGFDREILERGNKAVKQSLEEAERSLDVNTVSNMLMVKQGHVRSA